ncbi:MAG: response regulator transcription factor [Mesorhizobium sp.]|uniref:response regulator n=1 Tax=Mesorhizobium sp. TaxID=1871066 RepID=UPI000FE9DC9E|nr:response regulator transcription factor [Mesorhizobium sp.]RWH79315.1 MAG: response regulator transcription factor [Mesorhizobium sp.]RWH81844.1 MAG: response regulator transcription factor [Mesorhizobium sp.]RWH88110.1 MAG: response regulator transcription factor [Mesorhizobium sp.]RWI01566.1 MAG: response regulator transcription factor [Mesorhizobium sp.]RWI02013.1 MAG: response regulator transcription factor [Mesorhizobium sp.]
MTKQKLLIVDDEAPLREMLSEYLLAHDFDVRSVADGTGMLTELDRFGPDLVILDVNLVGESGYDLAREITKRSRTGILMLTAVGDLPHRLEGLAAGADDYMTKPFEPRELLARVRSVIRRLGEEERTPENRIRFGGCILDMSGRTMVDPDGADVQLTSMEFDLLCVFARHPRQILSRDQLCRLAHNRDLEPGDRSIDIRITRLRKKFETEPDTPTVLVTVRGEGYVYEPAYDEARRR